MSETNSIWGKRQTLAEAESAKAKREAENKKGGDKVPEVKIEAGDNIFRIVPIVGTALEDGTHVFGDYGHFISYMWTKMQDKSGKDVNRKVMNASKYGYESDPLLTFRNLLSVAIKDVQKTKKGVKADALKDINDLLFKSNYPNNTLSLQQKHEALMYVMQDGEFKLLARSSAQFKSLDDERVKIWKRREGKSKTAGLGDPVLDPENGFNVILDKSGKGNDTKYNWTIDTDDDEVPLGEEEGAKLMAMPPIHTLNKYDRYQFEVTVEFLKQYSQQYEIKEFGIFES